MALVFLLLGHATHTLGLCPIYQCKNSMSFSSASICQLTDPIINTTYSVACTGNYICNFMTSSGLESECIYNSPYTPGTQVAGTKCVFDEDCVSSNLCIDGTCKGNAFNTSCASHLDCDVGLYCSALTSLCVPQIAIGQTGCFEDAHCVNNAGCQTYSTTNANYNLCTKYFSLPDYTSLLGCPETGSVNYLCASGFCVNIGTSICYPAPRHAATMPITCNSNNDCVSSPTGKLNLIFYSDCGCGLGNTGTQQCDLLPEDDTYNEYDDMVRDWVNSGNMQKCNTFGRFGYACQNTFWTESRDREFYVKEIKALHYQDLQGALDCTVQTMFPKYYKELHGVALGLGLGITLILGLL